MTDPASLPPDAVALLGVPFDENASGLRGQALAPARVREVLHAGAMNLCTEDGRDLAAEPRWRDVGDVDLPGGAPSFPKIEEAVAAILARGARILTVGGDHSITYPLVRAHARKYAGLHLLHLDAHPDLYDELDGNRHSHACPFARIMEEGIVARLVQVGVRTFNPHQRAQATRFGVEGIEMRDWPRRLPAFDGPVYLSLDLDALDPAFAPGVSHPEPGGLTTREVLGILRGLRAPLAGADLVEFNPARDPAGITAALAAKLVKEITALLLR